MSTEGLEQKIRRPYRHTIIIRLRFQRRKRNQRRENTGEPVTQPSTDFQPSRALSFFTSLPLILPSIHRGSKRNDSSHERASYLHHDRVPFE